MKIQSWSIFQVTDFNVWKETDLFFLFIVRHYLILLQFVLNKHVNHLAALIRGKTIKDKTSILSSIFRLCTFTL